MIEHNGFKDRLIEELTILNYHRQQLSKSLEIAPEGTLHVLQKSGKNPDLYWYKQDRSNRKYIKKKETELAHLLAQKSYDTQLLDVIENRIAKAEELLESYSESIDAVYADLSQCRKGLVTPINISDEEYIRQWYEKHPGSQNDYPINGANYTNKGEWVRSKSEKILADLFARMDIPYVYEPQLRLNNGTILYPDFLLLNIKVRKTYIYEHFGMMGDSAYSEKVSSKISQYEQNGLLLGDKLLFSMESLNEQLNAQVVERNLRKRFR